MGVLPGMKGVYAGMKGVLPQARSKTPFYEFCYLSYVSFNLFVNVIVIMCSILVDKHLLFASKSNFLCVYL